MNVRLLIFPGFFMIFSTACSQNKLELAVNSLIKFSVDTIRVGTLAEELDDKKIYLLDTRSEREYEVSHIPGARYVGFKNFEKEKVEDIPKDAMVVTYCSVGYRSEKVAEKLKKLGYQDVHNLYGGIFDWKNNNHQIVDTKENATDSIHAYNRVWSVFLNNGIKVYD